VGPCESESRADLLRRFGRPICRARKRFTCVLQIPSQAMLGGNGIGVVQLYLCFYCRAFLAKKCRA
jgi:hypothetical protein